jgi:hypothetical protein
MKKVSRMMLLGLVLTLAGCAAINPVPEGSQPLGTYQGLVWGGIDGPIQIELFQAPNGDTVFSGQFVNTADGGVCHFGGAVFGNSMDGKIDMALGTISGLLSADGTQMTGTLKFAQYHASWNASQQ